MTTFSAALRLEARGDLAHLEEHLDEILAELEKLDAADVDYAAALGPGTVEFSGFVEAKSPGDASKKFAVLVRTAIHAAKGRTPGWPAFDDTHAEASVTDRVGLIDA